MVLASTGQLIWPANGTHCQPHPNSDTRSEFRRKPENSDTSLELRHKAENSDISLELRHKAPNSDIRPRMQAQSENSDISHQIRVKNEWTAMVTHLICPESASMWIQSGPSDLCPQSSFQR